jgi:hypothetical protein
MIRISSLPRQCAPCYSDQRLIGHVCEQSIGFDAYSWPSEIYLGTYLTAALASAAITLVALKEVRMLGRPIEVASET